jgi:hypothetical protein
MDMQVDFSPTSLRNPAIVLNWLKTQKVVLIGFAPLKLYSTRLTKDLIGNLNLLIILSGFSEHKYYPVMHHSSCISFIMHHITYQNKIFVMTG